MSPQFLGICGGAPARPGHSSIRARGRAIMTPFEERTRMVDMDIQTRWLLAAAALLSSLMLGILVRALVMRRLAAFAESTRTALDDLFVAATRRQVLWWFLLGGLVIAARLAPLSERALLVVDRISSVGLI